MDDIVKVLEDWDKSLADMDKGESDWGIMTQIRCAQQHKIRAAIREIKKLRAAEVSEMNLPQPPTTK